MAVPMTVKMPEPMTAYFDEYRKRPLSKAESN